MATPKTPLTRAQFALVATGSVAFSFLWAMLCNLVIEYLQTGLNTSFLFEVTLSDRFPLFFLGASIIWCIFLTLWALTGRLRIPTAVLLAAAVVLGYANYKKGSLRLEPLYPSDFGFAGNIGFLREMVSPSSVLALTAVVLLVVLIVLLVARILGRTWRRVDRAVHPRRWMLATVTRVLTLARGAVAAWGTRPSSTRTGTACEPRTRRAGPRGPSGSRG